MNCDSILQKLLELRRLPSYQLERRIDAFMLPYLEKVFNSIFKVDDFVFAYAEFPIKTINFKTEDKTFKGDKSACYVDYLLWSDRLNIVFLVEFKSDHGSIGDDQFYRYIRNAELGWRELMMNYYRKINSKDWKKFCYGLEYLYGKSAKLVGQSEPLDLMPFIEENDKAEAIKRVGYLQERIDFPNEPDVAFIYLGPSTSEVYLTKMQQLHGDSVYHAPLISLETFAEHVEEPLKSVLQQIDKGLF